MKKPAAQTSKTPVKKGALSSSQVNKKPAGSDGALFRLSFQKKPSGSGGELSRSTTAAPQTPASDATTRHLGSPKMLHPKQSFWPPPVCFWNGMAIPQRKSSRF